MISFLTGIRRRRVRASPFRLSEFLFPICNPLVAHLADVFDPFKEAHPTRPFYSRWSRPVRDSFWVVHKRAEDGTEQGVADGERGEVPILELQERGFLCRVALWEGDEHV